MGQQWLVAAGAVISARGVERRKLVEGSRTAMVNGTAASQRLAHGTCLSATGPIPATPQNLNAKPMLGCLGCRKAIANMGF